MKTLRISAYLSIDDYNDSHNCNDNESPRMTVVLDVKQWGAEGRASFK